MHSGSAWCIHWTSAFVDKQCDLLVKRKVPWSDSLFLTLILDVSAFTRRHSGCARTIHWAWAFAGKNVSCLANAEDHTQNLLFWLQPTKKFCKRRAFWLCMVHKLNKRFREKAWWMVCTAQNPKQRINFLTFSRNVKRLFFYVRVFWLCVVHTLNRRFRGKALWLACQAMSA